MYRVQAQSVKVFNNAPEICLSFRDTKGNSTTEKVLPQSKSTNYRYEISFSYSEGQSLNSFFANANENNPPTLYVTIKY